jgi:hypothetical protein
MMMKNDHIHPFLKWDLNLLKDQEYFRPTATGTTEIAMLYLNGSNMYFYQHHGADNFAMCEIHITAM